MQVFKVDGMTCGHCKRAVTSAVQRVDPAARVEVDLAAGLVRTDSAAPADRLGAAIAAEGYGASLVSAAG